ncbi:Phage-related baseplate assembly protein [Enhygromyxa salina]|uniref:Phage-related baseplate assembly protein n=1 Tax=Enhygromyxa salina TaxID=215803 RepID=A0A2S9XFH2_9BACT|nr:type VI secretion system tip protein TssI/VgrG [Enhygromyxa salina]PRP91510.1 Phage-related baseplate assembly protein [Enhygromyxa salina]
MSDNDTPNDLEQQASEAAVAAGSTVGQNVPDAPSVPSGAASGVSSSAPKIHGDTLGDMVSDAMHAGVPAAADAIEDQVEDGLEALGLPPEIASAGADALGGVIEDGLEAVVDAVEDLIGSDDPLPKVNYTLTVEDGPDAIWAVRSLHFAEALSEPYVLTLDLVSEELTADTELMLGANIELTIDRETIVRTVHGIVHLVEYIGVVDDRLQIRVEIVPALHLLSQRVDTRLWQDTSVVDVVTEVLEGAFTDYEREVDATGLSGTYNPREYIVQYHESDFDFVSRLLEAEGITYWFDHERDTGREVMVLEDSNDNYLDITTIDESPELHIIVDRADRAEVESLQYLDWTRELTSTAVYQRVFDWLTPIEPIESGAPPEGEEPNDDRGLIREVYHHGRFVEDDPDPRTVRKLVRRTQRDKIARGHSNVTGLFPGRKFSVVEHQRDDLDQEYLVRRIVHTGDCPDVVMGDNSALPRYQNRFEVLVVHADKPFRPPLVTPVPRIYGPQTAIVTGPEGEEIHTDEHGRIKVRFDWDRVNGLTDDTSMWIRVAHHWAGPGFGTFFLPRIGMEVVVEFLEGSPARPLVSGCVYNGDNTISVGVPDNKTQSTIRTKSSPDSDGYNEMRFEDAAGSEEIFVHAQKDYNEVVENCHSTSVGADQSNTVSGNQTQTVKKDQTETVEGHQKMTVQKTRTTEITEDEGNTYHASRSTTVEVNELLEVLGTTTIRSGDTVTLEAQKDYVQTVGGSSKISVNAGPAGPGDSAIDCANNFIVEAATKVHVSQGGSATITLEGGNADHYTSSVFSVVADGDLLLDSTGGTLTGQASSKVEFLNSGGAIAIEGGAISISSPSEVTISVGGNSVKVDSSGVTVSGAKVDVSATGVTTVSGSIVKLN